MKEIADLVMSGFYAHSVIPRIAEAVSELPLFQGLNKEQVERLAGACSVMTFNADERVCYESENADRMYIILEGRLNVTYGAPGVKVGAVEKGEIVGEMSLLSSSAHSATVTAETKTETAVLKHHVLGNLVRRRPDIGVIIYRNLGVGLGKKLLRSDHFLHQQALKEGSILKESKG